MSLMAGTLLHSCAAIPADRQGICRFKLASHRIQLSGIHICGVGASMYSSSAEDAGLSIHAAMQGLMLAGDPVAKLIS